MRRSYLAATGIAAVLMLAACAPDSAEQLPLAPLKPTLAQSPLCSNSLASDIVKQQKALYAGAALTDVASKFDAVKAACPGDSTSMVLMNYLEATITHRPESVKTITEARAKGIVGLWKRVTLYFTNDSLVRSFTVLTDSGGAEVLSPGEEVTTFDKGAQLVLDGNSTPGGQHLFTIQRMPTSSCDGTTSLRVTGTGGASLQGKGTGCYDIKDYPHETSYSPKATLFMCLKDNFGLTGIVHQTSQGGEVLPDPNSSYDCSGFHATNSSWLRTNGGPLGRVLASAYDYLAPRPLFADDAGESGSIGSFSLVGGALPVVLQDNFGEINNPPDIGDAWQVDTTFPGYIRVESSFGLLTDSVVVLSQAQGNCLNCPPFRLLGTRVNSSQVEPLGSYQVTWTSLQNKPNVKDAPFVILNENGAEIARLSYVTVSSQNRLIFTVRRTGTDSVVDVGSWVKDQPQNFKITVHQTVLGNNDNSVSFGFGINPTDPPLVGPIPTPFASKLMKVGYVLTGIDAGIIASNKWVVLRLSDSQ